MAIVSVRQEGSMTFTSEISKFVRADLSSAQALMREGRMEDAFRCLEDAHVLGQQSTKLHVLVHFRMLQWALKKRDFQELGGQLSRWSK